MATNKNKRIAAAQRFTQRGQLDKAIKEYVAVIEEDPSDVRIWLKVGDLQTKKGSILKAVQTYNRVADHYNDKGFFLKAVAVYKQILNIDPTHVDAHLKLGELYVQLGLTPDAIGQFQIVVGSYERDGRSPDSLALLKKIVELSPDDVANRIRLAEAYAAQGDTQLAVEEFSLVLDQLHNAARLDEFIQVAERLLYISPDELDVVRRLSDAYLRRGDAKRALARLQVLFRADPTNVETLHLLANAFQEIGQKAKAVSVFRELARIHADQGDETGRQSAYGRLLALAPDDEEALEATGGDPIVSDVEASIPPTATGSFSRLVVASSAEVELTADQQLRLFLDDVELYLKYELRDHATERLERVFEIDPHNVEGLLKLKELALDQQKPADAVSALLRLGEATRESDPQQAMEYLGEALQLHPGHPDATARMKALSSGMAERLASREPARVASSDEDDDGDFGDLDLGGIDFDDDMVLEDEPAHSREEVGAVDFELDLGALDEPLPDDDPFGDLLSDPPAEVAPPAAVDDEDDFGGLLLEGEPSPEPSPAAAPDVVIAPPPSGVVAGAGDDDDFGDLLLDGGSPPPPPPSPTPVPAADDDDDFGGLLMEAPVRQSVAPAAIMAPRPPPAAAPTPPPAAAPTPPAATPTPPPEDEDDFGDLLGDLDDEDDGDAAESVDLPAQAPDHSIDAGDLIIDEDEVGEELFIGMAEADDELVIGDDVADLVIGFDDEESVDESALEDAMEATVAIDPSQLIAAYDRVVADEPDDLDLDLDEPSADDEDELDEPSADDEDELVIGAPDEPEADGGVVDLSAFDDEDPADFDLSAFDDEPEPEGASTVEPAADFDVGDFDVAEPEPRPPADAEDALDLGDFDAPESEVPAEPTPEPDLAPEDDELDLGDFDEPEPEPEPAVDSDDDLDLDDFDAPEPEGAAAPDEAAEPEDDLDLGLGELDAPEPAPEDDLGFDLDASETGAADLGFDLDVSDAPEPEEAPGPEDDFAPGADLALGDDLDAEEDLDLDLGDFDAPAATEAAELDDALDLGELPPPDAPAGPVYDLDLHGFDAPVPEVADEAEDDLDLGDFGAREVEDDLDLGELDASGVPDMSLDSFNEPALTEAADLELGEFDVDPSVSADEPAEGEGEDELGLDLGDFDDPSPAPRVSPVGDDTELAIEVGEVPAPPGLDLDGLSFGATDAPSTEEVLFGETDVPATDALPPMPSASPLPLELPMDLEAPAVDEEPFEAEAEISSLPGVALDLGDDGGEGDEEEIEEIELGDDDIIELDDDDMVMEEDDEDDGLPSVVSRMQAAPPPAPLSPIPAAVAGPAYDLEDGVDFSEADDRTLMAAPSAVQDLLDRDAPGKTADLSGELEELDFSLAQGFADDARELFDELASRHPNHPDLGERRERLDALAAEHAEVAGSLNGHLDEHEGDLGTVVGTELSELAPDDADTHFDLGVAFKQMGQYKKAISELEVAARNADKRPEALRVIALCNLEQGNPTSAVEHLGQALTSPQLNPAARIGLHYDLATAFEQLGDTPRAIAELRAILDEGASDFLDVQERLTRLGG